MQKINRYLCLFFSFFLYCPENTSDLAADRIETVMHAAYRAFPSVTDIYPEIGTDLTRVTWAHGVDSRKKLDHTLRGKHINFEIANKTTVISAFINT